jgi:hypothetical protein
MPMKRITFSAGFGLADPRQWAEDVHGSPDVDVHHAAEDHLQGQGVQGGGKKYMHRSTYVCLLFDHNFWLVLIAFVLFL